MKPDRPLLVPPSPTFDHLPTLVIVAEYAAGLIGTELVEFDVDDVPFTHELVASEIAIVVAHTVRSRCSCPSPALITRIETLTAASSTVG